MEPPYDLSKTRVVDQHCHLLPGSSDPFTRDFFVKVMSLESYNPEYVIQQSIIDQYLKGSQKQKRDLDKDYEVQEVLTNSARSGETTLLFKEFLKEFSS